ncbi:MAG: hypothetical protein ACFFAH_14960 [Promethearchaeota archaeon]
MKEINFMTIGDKNYFPLINFSIKKVLKFYPDSRLFIYDWGFTPSQRKKINSYSNTTLIDWANKIDRTSGYRNLKRSYEDSVFIEVNFEKVDYLMNQKPVCILDCAKRIKENLIYFDGDAIIINPIDEIFEDNFDIGITITSKELLRISKIFQNIFYEKIPETKDVIKYAKKMQEIYYPSNFKLLAKMLSTFKNIGNLNAGVIFFKLDSKHMQVFIQEWINEIKTHDVYLMEQYSLFNLINKRNKEVFDKSYNTGIISLSNVKFKIKSFPMMIYNQLYIKEGYDDKKVKFLHFLLVKNLFLGRKNRANAIRELIREIKFRQIYFKFLKLFPPITQYYIKKIIKVYYLVNLILFPLNYYWIKFNRNHIMHNIKNIMKISFSKRINKN